jgi:hypothetical protein
VNEGVSRLEVREDMGKVRVLYEGVLMESGIEQATAGEAIDEPRESLGVSVDLLDDWVKRGWSQPVVLSW